MYAVRFQENSLLSQSFEINDNTWEIVRRI